MCGECHAAGFRRRLCDSSACSSTVDPRNFALCPRSDVARETFELGKMRREDKARPLLVTEVFLRKLSLNTPNGAFWEPWGHLWTNLENMEDLVSVDGLWTVIVPKPFCTFGELRHILLHFYRIDVPVRVWFFNSDTWKMYADDEYLELHGVRNVAFWEGPGGPMYAPRNRDFLPKPLSEESEDDL